MRDFHWLHFSDLHFELGAGFDSALIRTQLFTFLDAETRAGRLPYDYVFITGDLANKGSYDSVHKYMNELFASLDCRPNEFGKVFWAVGNHDILRSDLRRNSIITKIFRDADGESKFEEFMKHDLTKQLFHNEVLGDYIKWHKNILCRDAFGRDDSDESGKSGLSHCSYKLPELNLVILNTCLTSCDDNDSGNLIILESDFTDPFSFMNRNPENPTIVIGHHGMEFFTKHTRSELPTLFDDAHVDLYLCGHSHQLGHEVIRKEFGTSSSRDIHQITCGSGKLDGDAMLSFMHGHYESERHQADITPFTYDRIARRWGYDSQAKEKLFDSSPLPLTGRRESDAPQAVQSSPVQTTSDFSTHRNEPTSSNDWSSFFFSLTSKGESK